MGPAGFTSTRSSGISSGRSGLILLEVLAAMVVLELGTLAFTNLFLVSIRVADQLEQQIQMLNQLRGEMEILEKTPLNELPIWQVKQFENFKIQINTQKCDENRDGLIDYRKVVVTLLSGDNSMVRRNYYFITFR